MHVLNDIYAECFTPNTSIDGVHVICTSEFVIFLPDDVLLLEDMTTILLIHV
jgi:hypothetical protein